MKVKLAYGKSGLSVALPEDPRVTVVEPRFVDGLMDPGAALSATLRDPNGAPPLRELAKPVDRVGVVFSDVTRPTPNHLILPAVLEELRHIPSSQITLFNALGTHRANTREELVGMLGERLIDKYRIVQNDAFDPATQVHLGSTERGHEVWINKEFLECDLKILTGFIEPHFFAGFSGGGKAVMPGMAGLQTVLGNHDASMICDSQATWGITEGNPVWEEVRKVAKMVGRTFLVNVALNRDKEITRVFAGDLESAHRVGCDFVRDTAMVPVPEPFDIVITSNSGFPLDLNLYQAVKGMAAATLVVRPGGAIIIAADCWDGIPDHGLYGQLLREADSPQHLLDTVSAPGFLKQDQWQAQIQAQVQVKADVYVRTDNLSDEQISSALLNPCGHIEDTVAHLLKKFGPDATICVLPEGPQTIPYVDRAYGQPPT